MFVEYKREVDKLIAANFTREQAEAIVQQIENQQRRSIEELVTTHQLQDTCNELKNDLKEEISKIRLEFIQANSELRQELVKANSELRQELVKANSELREELLKVASEAKLEVNKLQYNFRVMFIVVIVAMFASPYMPDVVRYLAALIR